MKKALLSRASISGAEQFDVLSGVEQTLTDTARAEVGVRNSRGNGITEQLATQIGRFTQVAAN